MAKTENGLGEQIMSKDTNGRTQTRWKTRNVSKRIFMKTRFSTEKNKRQVGISLNPEDFFHFSSNKLISLKIT